MRNSLKIGLLLFLFWEITSCGKNDGSFSTTPSLTYQDIFLDSAGIVNIVALFRDKQGDVSADGGSVWVQVNNLTTVDNSVEFFDLPMPNFPEQANLEAEMTVQLGPLDFSVGSQQGGGADSIYFDLFLQDAKGNISDTIGTDTILIVR